VVLPLPQSDRNVAFSALFRTEFSYVWSSLRRCGVSPRDTDDVAHEVFIKVYEKLPDYDTSRPIKPWLFGFAYRAASDYRKLARHRIEQLGHEGREAVEAPNGDSALEQREDAALVEEALEAIDLERRAVLVAYELDETPMKEIADALEIPLHTGYSRLRVAREEFAAAVRRIRLQRGEP
jgi:RNA polymerase sigma-70 factor, ECF subfamily